MNPNPQTVIREWTRVRPDEWDRIEAGVRRNVRVRDDFVRIPFPRIASASSRQIVQAAEQYKKAATIVDPRLSREATLAVKAMAFADLCDRLRADTGIKISAGPSVADEKVTLFCEDRPLRKIMREINRVFGFTWLRSGEPGKLRYALDQDLKSQLAEEELRDQDFHAALVALDQKLTSYRPTLAVPPHQAPAPVPQPTLAVPPDQAPMPVLQRVRGEEPIQTSAGPVWGPIAIYFRLSPAQRAVLWGGDTLDFNNLVSDPERALPADVAHRLLRTGGAADIPGVQARVTLRLLRSKRGQVSLEIWPIVQLPSDGVNISPYGPQMVTAQSPSVRKPDNAAANQSLAQQAAFEREVSLKPAPSCPWFDPKRRPARDDFRTEIGGRSVYADQNGCTSMGATRCT